MTDTKYEAIRDSLKYQILAGELRQSFASFMM